MNGKIKYIDRIKRKTHSLARRKLPNTPAKVNTKLIMVLEIHIKLKKNISLLNVFDLLISPAQTVVRTVSVKVFSTCVSCPVPIVGFLYMHTLDTGRFHPTVTSLTKKAFPPFVHHKHGKSKWVHTTDLYYDEHLN